MPKNLSIPFSQFLIYQDENGVAKLDVRFDNSDVWLTQQQLAELFECSRTNIVEHISNIYEGEELFINSTCRNFRQVQMEGKRQVARELPHYNLDMIISLGYRVNSKIATKFRIWATQRLREYIQKGFSVNVDRLKNPDIPFDYFEELEQIIQDIRTSERRFYLKIADIYATSIDYDKEAKITKDFFATVQNKMHWAISGQTAAEIIYNRANSKRKANSSKAAKSYDYAKLDRKIARFFGIKR